FWGWGEGGRRRRSGSGGGAGGWGCGLGGRSLVGAGNRHVEEVLQSCGQRRAGGSSGTRWAVGTKRGRWMVDTIWREARRLLGAELSAKDFEAWVEPLRATGWSDGVLTLEVPSAFFRDWLRRHFLGRLEGALARSTGRQA